MKITFTFLILLSAFIFPEVVEAVADPLAACRGANASWCSPQHVLSTSMVPQAGIFAIRMASGLAILFVVIAGFQMMMSFGDESKVSQGRWAVINALLGLSVAIGSQLIVSFVATDSRLSTVSTDTGIFAAAVEILLIIFNAIFVIIIILAGTQWILGRGKPEDVEKGKKMVAWSITGAIIVNLANAIVRSVTTFFNV